MKGAAKGAKGAPRAPRLPPPSQPARPSTGTGTSVSSRIPKVTSPATAILVYSTSERDEVGIRTLAGEYKEEGSNHGRKVYRKTGKSPEKAIDVFLYFWDERDGVSFSGWWFGNKVGGEQVWSRNNQKTPQPPKSGWTIPWDGDVKKELVVMTVAAKQEQERKRAQLQKAQRLSEEQATVTKSWEERLQHAAERAGECQVDVEEAIEKASEALQGDLDDGVVKVAQQQLAALATPLAETQRFLASEGVAAQKAPPEIKAQMSDISQRLKKAQADLKEQHQRLKNAKAIKAQEAVDEEKRAEEELRETELGEQHTRQLEEMFSIAKEKVEGAEDEVEKVHIAAAPLQIDTGDEIRPVMLQAIKDTEQHVRSAQNAIGEARRYISGKLSQAQRFVSSVKKTAVEDFSGLQDRLAEIQTRLNPHKTIRQDYEQRVQGKKLLEDLNAKLAGAEIEVEKAAMMTAPLGGDNSEAIKETENSLASAQSQLSQTSRLIESKLKSMEKQKGPVYEEVKVLQDRTKAAQAKLDEVRKDLKEQQVRMAAEQLLKEVSDKVCNAEDELQRMSGAEMVFAQDKRKGSDLDPLLDEAESISNSVHSALADAQAFVAKKLVEIARFSEGQAKAVKEDLAGLQTRLEEGRARLQQFKSSNADRKRTQLLQEVEEKVTVAEAEMQRMSELSKALGKIGSAGEVVPESLKETLEQVNNAERTAQAGIVVARKALLQKTAELKKFVVAGSGSGSELGRFQTRVNNMQQQIAILKQASKDAEERVRVKQMLAEVVMRLQATEVDVDKVAASAVPASAEESPAAEDVERVEKSAASAQAKLTATAKLIDVKLKSAQGFLRDELQGMRARAASAEQKLAGVVQSAAEQKERMQAADVLARALEMVDTAEENLKQMAEAELPFLKGLEDMATEESIEAIAACEEAAASGQKSIADARTFIVHKLADIKEQFSETSQRSCVKDLTELQKRLDTGAGKLAELKKDTTERKRKSQMQASAEKISQTEGFIQKLATVMKNFAEDKLADISADEARTICEEIGKAEQAAQRAVSSSKKFLQERLKEIKSYAESHRAPMTADLSKLQSRLTQCQVELAKMSKTCTEREQRYVAQKLIQDTTVSLDKLSEEIEAASKVSVPLLADDTSELLGTMYVNSLTGTLTSYMQSSGATQKELFAKVSSKDTASAADFTAFLDKLVELTGKDDLTFTEEQSSAIFKRIVSTPGAMSFADFKALFKECYICMYSVTLTGDLQGSTETGTVEPGEAIEAMETKADDGGAVHVRCTLAKDGTSGWVSLKSTDGVMNFKPSLTGAPRMESIFAYVEGIHAKCVEAAEFIDQKTTEVSGVRQGPLAEVKAKLLQLRMRVSQEQAKIDQLKQRAKQGHDKIMDTYKEEIQKTLEVRCQAFAERTMKEAREAVEAAEKKSMAAIEAAKAGHEGKTMSELEPIHTAYNEAMELLAEAKKVVSHIQEKHAAFRGTRPILLQQRLDLTKLRNRAESQEKKCTEATKFIRDAYDKHVKEACAKARTAIRRAARKSGQTGHEAFVKAASGTPEMTEEQFCSFLAKLPDLGLSKGDESLVFKEAKPTRWPGFAKLVQEYTICEKGVAITDGFDIGNSSTVGRLAEKELWEIIEGPREDPETKVERVRGRALKDGTIGWVSVKGNQGSQFLRNTVKPFMCCSKQANLQETFASSAPVVRPLQVGELLEIIEGPRDEDVKSEKFLQGTASKDNAKGWITLQGSDGVISASPSKDFYVCRSLIAMTDVFDLSTCKVLKKVEPGDVVEVVGKESKEDSSIEVTRLQFLSAADGKQGWITLKGNQGTVYMECSQSHYRLDREICLRAGASKDSPVIRTLKAGEAFEAPEPPIEERPPVKMMILARAVEDQAKGWIVFQKGKSPVQAAKKN